MPKFSCQTTLLKMIEDWKFSLDCGKKAGPIAVDSGKAFDSPRHGLPIAKLSVYGVDFYSCKLLASYLYNRHQGVKLGDARSDWGPVFKGVPQGSISGHLLFNTFINDIFFSIVLVRVTTMLTITAFHSLEKHWMQYGKSCRRISWFLWTGSKKIPSIKIPKNSSHCLFLLDLMILVIWRFALPTLPLPQVKISKRLGWRLTINIIQHISNVRIKAGCQLNVLQRLKRLLDCKSRMVIYE